MTEMPKKKFSPRSARGDKPRYGEQKPKLKRSGDKPRFNDDQPQGFKEKSDRFQDKPRPRTNDDKPRRAGDKIGRAHV